MVRPAMAAGDVGRAPPVKIASLSFCFTMSPIANAAEDNGTSVIRSTPSLSSHFPAIANATSGFNCKSAATTSTGISGCAFRKSSTANSVPATDLGRYSPRTPPACRQNANANRRALRFRTADQRNAARPAVHRARRAVKDAFMLALSLIFFVVIRNQNPIDQRVDLARGIACSARIARRVPLDAPRYGARHPRMAPCR